MATVPERHAPEGGTRIWATFSDPGVAARAARALADAGVGPEQVTLTEDASTQGPIGREREHREGERIGRRLLAGGIIGASIGALLGVVIGIATGVGSTGIALFTLGGALFFGGVGAFITGLSSLRAATLDHRPMDTDTPGGSGVEVRAEGDAGRDAIRILQRHDPETLVVTDAYGRPLRDMRSGPAAPPERA